MQKKCKFMSEVISHYATVKSSVDNGYVQKYHVSLDDCMCVYACVCKGKDACRQCVSVYTVMFQLFNWIRLGGYKNTAEKVTQTSIHIHVHSA